MICTCERCLYTFETAFQPEQCPDCGKFAVRTATTREAGRAHTLVSVLYPYALGEEKPIALEDTRITLDGRGFDLVRQGDGYTLRTAHGPRARQG